MYKVSDEGRPRIWWSAALGLPPDTQYATLRHEALKSLVAAARNAGMERVTYTSEAAHAAVSVPDSVLLPTELGQLAAYWLNLYGALNREPRGGDRPSVAQIDANLTPHVERWKWYEIVSLPLEDRLTEDAERGFVAMLEDDENPIAMAPSQRENARFWMYVLDDTRDRFLTNIALDYEALPPERQCGLSRIAMRRACYRRATTLVGSSYDGGMVDLCPQCAEEFAVQPIGMDVRYLRGLCTNAYEAPRNEEERRGLVEAPSVYFLNTPTGIVAAMNTGVALHRCRCGAAFTCSPTLYAICPNCGRSEFDAAFVNYNANPTMDFQTVPFERTKLFFGVELEIEYASCSTSEAKKILRAVHDPSLIYKKDTSIGVGGEGGIEMISCPKSFARWQADEAEWKNRLDTLRAAGMRSYDSGKCGMHIHISRAAFSAVEALKFMEFILKNRKLCEVVAQRPANGYCSFDGEDSFSQPNGLKVRLAKARQAFSAHTRRRYAVRLREPDTIQRHVAVNVPADLPTLELRIFRGTLNHASFCKNIEFAHAAVEFVKSRSRDDLSAESFLQFVANHAATYKHLVSFLVRARKKLEKANLDARHVVMPLPNNTKRKQIPVRIDESEFVEAAV